jgi:hypothetical protein
VASLARVWPGKQKIDLLITNNHVDKISLFTLLLDIYFGADNALMIAFFHKQCDKNEPIQQIYTQRSNLIIAPKPHRKRIYKLCNFSARYAPMTEKKFGQLGSLATRRALWGPVQKLVNEWLGAFLIFIVGLLIGLFLSR